MRPVVLLGVCGEHWRSLSDGSDLSDLSDPLAISVCEQKPIETVFAFSRTGVCRAIFTVATVISPANVLYYTVYRKG